jgi:hypothetical protein
MNRLLVFLIFLFYSGILQAGESNTQNLSQDTVKYFEVSGSNQFRRSIYIQFNVSTLYANLGDWQLPLHKPDGTHPSSNCTVFGGEAGWVINRYFQVGIGYEFFFTSKANTIEVAGDQISGTFLYGSLKIGFIPKSIQKLYLFGSLDVGSLSATESMDNYIVLNFERGGKTTAFRFMTGAQYYASENWSIAAGIGYLSGNIREVKAFGTTLSNISFNLSGLVLRASVNYHIPF